jgi:alkane 1-monooxygenase
MILFAFATLFPAALIALAATLGGAWPWLALAAMTLLPAALDALIPRVAAPAEGQEFPAADALSASLAVVHLLLLPLAVAAVAGTTGLTPAGRFATGLAAALWFGQVTHPNAHELIHRGSRLLFELGRWSYVSLLIGHHVSAHRLVHHPHVGTPLDPNTPREGQGFYRYALRAWWGSFTAGWRAESARRRAFWRHPYVSYVGGALAMLALGAVVAGPAGVTAWLVLAGMAQGQILLSDYVQHYGLTRAGGIEGTSWNAPHFYSSHLMLNAPRHSDHHAHPSRPYPALRLDASGPEPTLPRPLPAMATLALFPRPWKRLMRRELARLSGGASGT